MLALVILAAIAAPPSPYPMHDGFPVRHVWESGVGVSAVYQGAAQGTEAAALAVAENADSISGACWLPVPTLHRLWVWEPTGWRAVTVYGSPVLVRPATGECEWQYKVIRESAA